METPVQTPHSPARRAAVLDLPLALQGEDEASVWLAWWVTAGGAAFLSAYSLPLLATRLVPG